MSEQQKSYTVLARRYRPQTFESVVGQQHVAQALKNAIQAERVAHAYLFTGARGVGKTSMARILAKALNCPNAEQGEPCNDCEMCQAISTGSDVDVLEIDGASNRGIDDIRALRANVGIRSMRTRIKLYIIDEVHMLTKEAFNALLKTLEEPPPNVKFVFCTTEPQKVPDTILSRCQRFDFTSIETHAIAERLADIAVQEGVGVTSEAIDLVARRAGGSMRDSQSLFDQLLAFGGEQIEASDVNQLLGTADDDRLLELIEAMQQSDRGKAVQEVDAALQAGVQLGNLVDQLVNVYRDLMILHCGADAVELLGVGHGQKDRVEKLAQSIGLQTITAAMQILSETKSRLMRVPHARALIDLAIVRIALLEDLESVANMAQELKNHSGGSITIGQAGNDRPAASTTPAKSAEKKSLDVEPEAVSSEATEETDDEPPDQPPIETESETIEFADENRDQLWADLLEHLDESLTRNLKQADRIKIAAPNRFEIHFLAKHSFTRDQLTKPEYLRTIEARLAERTGENIIVKTYADAPDPSTIAISSDVNTSPQKHLFVEQAESIFNATISRIDRIRKS